MNKLIILIFALLTFVMTNSQSLPKPKVHIITTGGTIASQSSSPMIEGPALVQAVPQLADHADITVEEFVRIGSSKMTPEIWLSLVKRINQIIKASPDIKCLVITHGTDTMEETSFFLNLTHKHNVPIILVGSMRSSDMISADGPINLLNAVRVGVSEESIGMGVLVVMNDNISAARDLLKSNNNRVDAFLPNDLGYLGLVDNESVSYYRSSTKPHTTKSEFDVYNIEKLPTIDIVKDFAGFDKDILTYFLSRDSDGLVISSFAGGRMSNELQAVQDLDSTGKPIVISSSIKAGKIYGSNTPGSPIIIANDLPPNKARVLLMLALTVTKDPQEIQKIFNTY